MPEVVVPCGRRSAQPRVGYVQQRTVLLVLMEVIDTGWLMVAQPPQASLTSIANAKEWVESSRLKACPRKTGIICRRDQCATNPCEAIADSRILDAGQVRLERHAAVLDIVASPSQRATKLNRRRAQRGIAIRPERLVGNTVKASIGSLAS